MAILGVGGLGHLALQFANKMGGDVTALDISADKVGAGGRGGAGGDTSLELLRCGARQGAGRGAGVAARRVAANEWVARRGANVQNV